MHRNLCAGFHPAARWRLHACTTTIPYRTERACMVHWQPALHFAIRIWASTNDCSIRRDHQPSCPPPTHPPMTSPHPAPPRTCTPLPPNTACHSAAQYGSQSLSQHVPQCQKKWLLAEAAKLPRERRQLPAMPEELAAGGPLPTDPRAIMDFNSRMSQYWSSASLINCPICARSFRWASGFSVGGGWGGGGATCVGGWGGGSGEGRALAVCPCGASAVATAAPGCRRPPAWRVPPASESLPGRRRWVCAMPCTRPGVAAGVAVFG